MRPIDKPFLSLTAGDLMTREVVTLPQQMPLQEAVRLLLHNQVGGAPIVDEQGKCVGVLTAIDILRLAGRREDATRAASPPLPIACPFQLKYQSSKGEELTLCTLPPGMCPIQEKRAEPGEKEIIVCREPHCVLADWQVVVLEKLPTDEVRQFMTRDPVTVPSSMGIQKLARIMIDAHIHRVIVVDEKEKPVGVVSSTDMLAAVAYTTPDQQL